MASHHSEAEPIHEFFLFLRTPTAIDIATDCFSRFGSEFPYTSVCPLDLYSQFDDERQIFQFAFGRCRDLFWENGLVLKLRTYETISEFVPKLTKALDRFESWAIHDGHRHFAEHPTGGPLSRFFEQPFVDQDGYKTSWDSLPDIGYTQLFALTKRSDRSPEETIGSLRSATRNLCLPVFHFRDGQIVFLRSDEPASVSVGRFDRHLPRLRHWLILDSQGNFRSSDGGDFIWQRADLSYLPLVQGLSPNI